MKLNTTASRGIPDSSNRPSSQNSTRPPSAPVQTPDICADSTRSDSPTHPAAPDMKTAAKVNGAAVLAFTNFTRPSLSVDGFGPLDGPTLLRGPRGWVGGTSARPVPRKAFNVDAGLQPQSEPSRSAGRGRSSEAAREFFKTVLNSACEQGRSQVIASEFAPGDGQLLGVRREGERIEHAPVEVSGRVLTQRATPLPPDRTAHRRAAVTSATTGGRGTPPSHHQRGMTPPAHRSR